MKISAITSFNTINSAKKANIEKADQNVKTNMSVPIMKNSMAEAIGRSQVSFSGQNSIRGAVFEHSCSEVFGDREDISYDKRDGSFIHNVYDRRGMLKDKQEYYPAAGKEVITKVRNGITTISTRMPSGSTIEKLDELGRQILLDKQSADGSRTLIETEYDNNRIIVTQEYNGESAVRVFDLQTKKAVTSGPLIVKDYYDRETNTRYSKNLITGQLLKKEEYKPNGTLLSSVEYEEGTGRVTKKIAFDSKTGGYNETAYYKTGYRKSLIRTSKDSKTVEEFQFKEDGKTITSHIESRYDRNNNLTFETVFSPITGAIETETEYNDNGCTIYRFNKATEKVDSAQTYVDGILTKEIKFRPDGETYAYLKEIKRDGSFKETLFDEFGEVKVVKKYTADKFLYYAEEYDTITNVKIRSKEYNQEYQDSKESFFDRETGCLTKTITRDSDNRINRIVNYFDDGQTQRNRQQYNKDGSFTYTVFDEEGRIIREEEYNADGTRKENRRENTQRTTSAYGSQRSRRRRPSNEEIIKHIFKMISTRDSADCDIRLVEDYEWKVLGNILGTGDDKTKLINMDKETYRNLSKKFHPDINMQGASEEEVNAYTLLFQTINALWEQSPNRDKRAHG